MPVSVDEAEKMTREILEWVAAKKIEDDNAVPALLIAMVKIAVKKPLSEPVLFGQLASLLRVVVQEEVLRRDTHDSLDKGRTH